MQYDVILVSGEPYVDHPFSGVGVIKRVLEDKGFSVGVIETPDWKKDDDFLKLGKPRLFFGVSSGAMDSMVVNYTTLKKKREDSKFSNISYSIPDRAVTVYCNMIRKLFKESKMVIAGTESSLRRFAHYDAWDNKVRKSILLDSRADILVYGYGEKQIIEIASRVKGGEELSGINGTCVVSRELLYGFVELPSFDEVVDDKVKFCKMQSMFDVDKNLAQKFDNRYVLQYNAMEYTVADLDYVYSLPYSREIPFRYNEFSVVEFSVLTHRGCFAGCNFCSVSMMSGNKIVSRSKESIISEVKRIVKMPDFKGVIELSGASANMYGMDCNKCSNNCLGCSSLDRSHSKMISLLKDVRKIKGVKKVLIKSGVRYDLAIHSPEYVEEIIKHHIDNTLMIAPEHVDHFVLKLMKKDDDKLNEFEKMFDDFANKEKKGIYLSYYLMVGHPGCTIDNSKSLYEFRKKHLHSDFVQIFTPTPMTVSTCMYYTSLNPLTLKKVYVPYTYNEKKKQKNIVMGS